jgi:hypothetical protein
MEPGLWLFEGQARLQALLTPNPLPNAFVEYGVIPTSATSTFNLFPRSSTVALALSLEHEATGSTETRAESSLVLFNQRGRVLWEAP